MTFLGSFFMPTGLPSVLPGERFTLAHGLWVSASEAPGHTGLALSLPCPVPGLSSHKALGFHYLIGAIDNPFSTVLL